MNQRGIEESGFFPVHGMLFGEALLLQAAFDGCLEIADAKVNNFHETSLRFKKNCSFAKSILHKTKYYAKNL